jgi:hypothetical protein
VEALSEFEVVLCRGFGKNHTADVIALHVEDKMLDKMNLAWKYEMMVGKVDS